MPPLFLGRTLSPQEFQAIDCLHVLQIRVVGGGVEVNAVVVAPEHQFILSTPKLSADLSIVSRHELPIFIDPASRP